MSLLPNATTLTLLTLLVLFFVLTYLAWKRYLWAAKQGPEGEIDSCPYSLTEVFGDHHLVNVPHQEGIQWLTEVFSRSAKKYPQLTALQIPHTGESLTFAELDARAEDIAAAVAPYLTGPDQVVCVAMPQDNWQIVASHLGILKAGGTLMVLDPTVPEALITHMLNDAHPEVILTRGKGAFRDLPTVDVLALPEIRPVRKAPAWLDDPTQRLASIFYTSGTTGMPKGVECPHAGYVNLALSYADYFDLVPGMDATSLSSSLGYDGSISEMYSAWVSGCTVVMLTPEELRSGPDLIPVLREAEVTVLFCPPVLLTTLTQNPELDLPYPICRFIVPAGEAFPGALVEPWTRGRRQIINTYGPTEASTDTSRQSLRPGEAVTIGSPMANVSYVILEAGQLRPLPHGEIGELCIGGVHVARGYRNLPGETARNFITHPQFGRLYRTGDKCRIDIQKQRVHFLGRVDSQLKVRGHRVEIQAVEDILQTRFREVETAVLDYQNQELVAFVTAPTLAKGAGPEVTLAPAKWVDGVRATLSGQLPAPSVPGRIFLVDKFDMKPLSGKIDRKRLPQISQLQEGVTSVSVNEMKGPETGEESNSAEPMPSGSLEVLNICREVFGASLAWDDRFADNGGHSIIIAQLAQRLHVAGWVVPVRALLSDCDTARKVVNLPREPLEATEHKAAVDSGENRPGRDERAARVLSVRWFTILQALFLILLYLPATIGFLGLVAFAEIGEFFMTAFLWQFAVVGLLGYVFALFLPFLALLWVMLIKLCMGGHIYRCRVTPGVYPMWSRMHLRIWCIKRLERSVISPLGMLFRSAPLMSYVLRQLGARVGENLQCAHDVDFSGPLDLLSIGNNVAIQTGAFISLSSWRDKELHIGPIRLESECKIGMRAAVVNDVVVGQGACINPLTSIRNDVGSQEIWEGAPARFSGRCTKLNRTGEYTRSALPFSLLEALNILTQVFLDFWLFIFPTTVITWFAARFIPVSEAGIAGEYFSTTPLNEILWQMSLYTFLTTWSTIVLTSVLACLFVRVTPVAPGIYSSRGLRGSLLLYRIKKMNQVQKQWTWTISGQYLRALAGMRFQRLGASECDFMFNLVPELATAGSQVFWSNGCFTNMLDYGAEHIKLRQLDMPHNFFSGNNSVAEGGQFPTNFLLGVSTPGNDIRFRRQMRSRLGEPITVAGNPPLKFASADFEAGADSSRLPGFSLFLGRVFLNDIFSIGILRSANILVYALLYSSLLRWDGHEVLSAFIALIGTEFVLVGFCSLIKKIMVGRSWGSAHSTPFWSWRHFSYFFVQDSFFALCKIPLEFWSGTVLANVILRMMGCEIGKRSLLSVPLQASDWNAVSLGNDCIFDGFLQLHTFENMMLKVKRTEIRDDSTINFGTTIMGGAVIEPQTTLLPLSLVLKDMRLRAATYEGSPADPVYGLRGTTAPSVSGMGGRASRLSVPDD